VADINRRFEGTCSTLLTDYTASLLPSYIFALKTWEPQTSHFLSLDDVKQVVYDKGKPHHQDIWGNGGNDPLTSALLRGEVSN